MNLKLYGKRKYFLCNNKEIFIYFNILTSEFKLCALNKELITILNYNQYKGCSLNQNNFLIFCNKKAILNFFVRIKNLIKNFLSGYCIILEIIGLGFSVAIKNNLIRFNIGFNHSIFYKITQDVLICNKRKILFLFSYFYFQIKKIVVDIKNLRRLSPYKLKGIKEKNELYVKKNWKKKAN